MAKVVPILDTEHEFHDPQITIREEAFVEELVSIAAAVKAGTATTYTVDEAFTVVAKRHAKR